MSSWNLHNKRQKADSSVPNTKDKALKHHTKQQKNHELSRSKKVKIILLGCFLFLGEISLQNDYALGIRHIILSPMNTLNQPLPTLKSHM